MTTLTIGERIKIYRKLLDVSQKQLADNKVSSNLISLVERGKVPLSTVTASILVNNINKISEIKGYKLNLSIKDMYIPNKEYLLKYCDYKLLYSEGLEEINKSCEHVKALVLKYDIGDIKADFEKKFANRCFEEKFYKKAITHYEKYLENYEINYVEYRDVYKLGVCYFHIDENEKALNKLLNCYNMIINNEEDSKFIYELLSKIIDVYMKLDMYLEALKYLDQALTYTSGVEKDKLLFIKSNILGKFEDKRVEQKLTHEIMNCSYEDYSNRENKDEKVHKDKVKREEMKYIDEENQRYNLLLDIKKNKQTEKYIGKLTSTINFLNISNKELIISTLLLVDHYIETKDYDKADCIVKMVLNKIQ